MHNSNFKGFACFRAKGKNLNFGWGSIQEWGCIQVDTVVNNLIVIVYYSCFKKKKENYYYWVSTNGIDSNSLQKYKYHFGSMG